MSLRKQNPHDKFATKVFTDLALTGEFLEQYLPSKYSDQLDFVSLRLTNTKFVSAKYREHRTDFLYDVKTKSGQPIFIYILQEHKSFPEQDTLLQMLRDMIGKWEEELKNGAEHLTPIIPILFYHGYKKWPYPTDFRDQFHAESPWNQLSPNFEIILLDFSAEADRPIIGSHMLQSFLRAFRYARAPEQLDLNLFFFEIAPEGIDLNRPLLKFIVEIAYYLLEAVEKATPEALKAALHHQGRIGEQIVETAATKLREEGRLIGLREGRQEGRQEGQIETLRNTVLMNLEARFGSVPTRIKQKLSRIKDATHLQSLFAVTLTVTSLENFEQGID